MLKSISAFLTFFFLLTSEDLLSSGGVVGLVTMPDRKEAALKLTSSEKCLKVRWDGSIMCQLLRSLKTCVRYHVILNDI